MGLFSKNESTVIIDIEGMSCQHCAASVESALKNLSDVKKVKVDLSAGTAAVTVRQSVEDRIFTQVIEEAGFEVKKIHAV